MTDFYLVSTELRDPYKSRECCIARRLSSEIYDGYALVQISPPLPKEIYDTPEDLAWVILAPKNQGDSLFPVSEWPLSVYICNTKAPILDNKEFSSRQLTILDWGKILPVSTK